MSAQVRHDKAFKAQFARYSCNSRMAGANADRCNRSVSLPLIDGLVIDAVVNVLEPVVTADPAMKKVLAQEWTNQQRDPQEKDRAKRIARLEKQRDDAKQQLADAARLLVTKRMSQVAYDALQATLTEELHHAEQQLSELLKVRPTTAPLPTLDEVVKLAGSWRTILTEAPIPERRAVLAELIEQVIPMREGKGKYNLEIRWTPLGEQLSKLASQS